MTVFIYFLFPFLYFFCQFPSFGDRHKQYRFVAEHIMSQFKNGRGDSALHKHRVSDHEGEDMKFRMEITYKFRDPLTMRLK